MLKPPPKPNLPSWAFATINSPSFAQTLRFPENLPALSSRDLGLYHGQYTALLAYASSERSKVTVELLKVESEINYHRHQKSIMLSSSSSEKALKWQLESMLETSPQIVDLRKRQLHFQVQKESLQNYEANFERYAAALSREMSRRAAEQRVN